MLNGFYWHLQRVGRLSHNTASRIVIPKVLQMLDPKGERVKIWESLGKPIDRDYLEKGKLRKIYTKNCQFWRFFPGGGLQSHAFKATIVKFGVRVRTWDSLPMPDSVIKSLSGICSLRQIRTKNYISAMTPQRWNLAWECQEIHLSGECRLQTWDYFLCAKTT